MSIYTHVAIEIKTQNQWRHIEAPLRLPCTKNFRSFLDTAVPVSQRHAGGVLFPPDVDAESLLFIMKDVSCPSSLDGVLDDIKRGIYGFDAETKRVLALGENSREEQILACWNIINSEFFGHAWLLLSSFIKYISSNESVFIHGEEISFLKLLGESCFLDLHELKNIRDPYETRLLICFSN